jgi:6-phosphogluconolactonase (cycloisomerase 2 family)
MAKSRSALVCPFFLILNFFLLSVLMACGGGGGNTPPKPVPTLSSVTVTANTAPIGQGATMQMVATGSFSDGSTQNLTNAVTWSSSATSVATVSATGLVTTLTQGTTQITATSGTLTSSTTITVGPPVVQGITVSPSSSTIALGRQQLYSATAVYTDHSTQPITNATWSTSSAAIATIDATGLLMTKAVGNATVTATSGSLSGSTNLVVSQAALESITVNPSNASVPAGLTQQMLATGSFSDGTTKALTTLTWSSSDTTLATVNGSGVVSTSHQGSVTITAASGAISGSAPLSVAAPILNAIVVQTPPATKILLGSNISGFKYSAIGAYTDASNADITSQVTWTSMVPTVGSIDSSGDPVLLRPGYTEVSASLGSIISSAKPLTVLAYPRYNFSTTMNSRMISRRNVDFPSGYLRSEGHRLTSSFIATNGCLTIDPDQKFVYHGYSESNLPAQGKLEIYSLDAATGATTAVFGTPYKVDAPIQCVEFEPTGKFGFASASYNNTNDQLVTFSRDQVTGLLTQINTISLPSAPSTPAIDPQGHFLYLVSQYVTVGGQALVYGFSIDSSTGALTAIPGTPFAVGIGATEFAIHPNGKYAYLSNTAGTTIDWYAIDASTGKLTPLGSIAPCINPKALRFSMNGQFAYSSCSMENIHTPSSATVQSFSVAANGSLNMVDSVKAPDVQNAIVLDPSGAYLYVDDWNYTYKYKLDPNTGGLTTNGRVGSQALAGSMLLTYGASPVTYTPKFAFVSSTGDNQITSYAMATDGSFSNPKGISSQIGPFSLAAVPWQDEVLASSTATTTPHTAYRVLSDGTLAAGLNFGRSTSSGGIVMDPIGTSAFDLDSQLNGLYTYMRSIPGFWGDVGYDVAPGVTQYMFATGTTPVTAVAEPSGRYVFVGNQGSNSITVYEHWTSMQMLERTAANTFPYSDGSPYSLGAKPLRIEVDPQGIYLYALCDDQTLRVFSIDYASAGHLTQISSVALAAQGVGVTAMSTGNLVYVATTAGVTGYSLNRSTGGLTSAPLGSSVNLSNANGIYSDPSGDFLYATTSTVGSGAIYGYKVDRVGVLTALGAVATPNQPSSMTFTTKIE